MQRAEGAVLCQVEEKGKSEEAPQSRVQACIFKVGDDCRQDVLALQVVRPPPRVWGLGFRGQGVGYRHAVCAPHACPAPVRT